LLIEYSSQQLKCTSQPDSGGSQWNERDVEISRGPPEIHILYVLSDSNFGVKLRIPSHGEAGAGRTRTAISKSPRGGKEEA
jgi:hypothetical protein